MSRAPARFALSCPVGSGRDITRFFRAALGALDRAQRRDDLPLVAADGSEVRFVLAYDPPRVVVETGPPPPPPLPGAMT